MRQTVGVARVGRGDDVIRPSGGREGRIVIARHWYWSVGAVGVLLGVCFTLAAILAWLIATTDEDVAREALS